MLTKLSILQISPVIDDRRGLVELLELPDGEKPN